VLRTQGVAYLIEDALGGPVKAHIDDLLGIGKGSPDKTLYEYFIGSPGIHFPDHIIAYVERIHEGVEVLYPG